MAAPSDPKSSQARKLIQQQSYVNHMYGKHIDKLTSELIANLTKGISLHSRINSAVTEPNKRSLNNEYKSETKSLLAPSEFNDDNDDNDEEPDDYEDIRAEFHQVYQRSGHNNNKEGTNDPKKKVKANNNDKSNKSSESEIEDVVIKEDMDTSKTTDKSEKQDNKASQTAKKLTEQKSSEEAVSSSGSGDAKGQRKWAATRAGERAKDPSEFSQVIPDRFRKLLNRYDNIDYSADVFLRTHFHSVLSAANECNGQDGQESAQDMNTGSDLAEETAGEPQSIEMIHLLKRMMVKKKYEMYTIRQENLFKKNKLKRMSSQAPAANTITANASASGVGGANTNTNASANHAASNGTSSSSGQQPAGVHSIFNPKNRPSTASASTILQASGVVEKQVQRQKQETSGKLNR